jgi:excisionase family DNA binding protein
MLARVQNLPPITDAARNRRAIPDAPTMTTQAASDTADGATARPLLVTVAQAAALLSVSRTTLYELLACGAIESISIGRSRRVPVDALHDFVESYRRDSILR